MPATTFPSVGSLGSKIKLAVDVIGALKCRSELAEFSKANFPMIPGLYLGVVFYTSGVFVAAATSCGHWRAGARESRREGMHGARVCTVLGAPPAVRQKCHGWRLKRSEPSNASAFDFLRRDFSCAVTRALQARLDVVATLRIVYGEHRHAAGPSAKGLTNRLLSNEPLCSAAGGLSHQSAIAELPHARATDQCQSGRPLENVRAPGRRVDFPRERSDSGETMLAVSAVLIRAPGGHCRS